MKSKLSTILSPGQLKVSEELRPILQLATCGIKASFSTLNARTHCLLAGTSGVGKSHLAHTIAREACLPIFDANMASWIVLGARGENSTLVSLTEWIHKTPKGVIFMDELDKLCPGGASSSGNESPWYNSIKQETLGILDGRLPDGAIHVSESIFQDDFAGQLSPRECKAAIKADVEHKLRNFFFLIGAGTWQTCWENERATIGFNKTPATRKSIERHELVKSISPEILQRFRQVIFLEPLTADDYLNVLRLQTDQLPQPIRERFVEFVSRAIPQAVEHGLGMRIFEEAYTELCVEIIRSCGGDETVFRNVLVGPNPGMNHAGIWRD